MPITHAKVSGKSDGADATQIQPSDWNDEHVGSGGGLPSQWTDGGNGDVTATTDDFSAPITFDVTDPGSNDAIVVDVPDAGDISGNGYVLRVHDVPNDWHVFDVDAWGSALFKGPFDAADGTGGIDVVRRSDGSHVGFFSTRGDFFWQALTADTAKSAMWIQDVVLLRSGDGVQGFSGVAGIGFFDKANNASNPGAGVLQQTIDAPNATPEDIANILIAYGLAVQSP